MQFIDEATIYVRSGNGGNGAVAFHRTSNELGGPAGGDGGRGGSVIFVANPQLSTLLDFKFRQHYSAENGGAGQGRDKNGKGGEDLIVPMPVGTVVWDAETDERLADLAEPGGRYVIARGGQGGRGNKHFATPTHQTPRSAEQGTPGEERRVRLELKLLADVGLLGYPNVGKSTFVARVSRARPKIADYPFTTLVPSLGVVGLTGGRSFVIADIPGLIEGAAEGAGLGHRFLRHVERSAALLHILEVTGDPERDPVKDHDIINAELGKYDPELAARPQVVALGKMDLPDSREAFPALAQAFTAKGIELHPFSAATGEGVPELLERLWKMHTARKGARSDD
jgi:GTP-binding protein